MDSFSTIWGNSVGRGGGLSGLEDHRWGWGDSSVARGSHPTHSYTYGLDRMSLVRPLLSGYLYVSFSRGRQ